ncbi:uncharacterized protein [Engystomops pustulosus]|uniref:uncharacterized protein isoform X3 n=1 Tax=Engystomops pustulosus TaxID=76066 RepID=UPI003AFA5B91
MVAGGYMFAVSSYVESAVVAPNFQILCAVKNQELQQTLRDKRKREKEKKIPAKKMNMDRGKSHHPTHNRMQGQDAEGTPWKRPVSESDHHVEDDPQKTHPEEMTEDGSNTRPSQSHEGGASSLYMEARRTQMFQPLVPAGMYHPMPPPAYRPHLQTIFQGFPPHPGTSYVLLPPPSHPLYPRYPEPDFQERSGIWTGSESNNVDDGEEPKKTRVEKLTEHSGASCPYRTSYQTPPLILSGDHHSTTAMTSTMTTSTASPQGAQPDATIATLADSPTASPQGAQPDATIATLADSPTANPQGAQPDATIATLADSPTANPQGAQPDATIATLADSPTASPQGAQPDATITTLADSPTASPQGAQPDATITTLADSPTANPQGAQPDATIATLADSPSGTQSSPPTTSSSLMTTSSPYIAQPVGAFQPATSLKLCPRSFVNFTTNGSSVPLEKPITTSTAGPHVAQPIATINPVISSAESPSRTQSVPSFRPSSFLDCTTNGSSVLEEKPTTFFTPGPHAAPPVANIKPVISSAESPSRTPSLPTNRSSCFGNFTTHSSPVSEEKPTTSTASPYIAQPGATIKPLTPLTGSPSSLPSLSYSRRVSSHLEDSHVEPVMSHLVPDDKPTFSSPPTFKGISASPKRRDRDKVPEICLSHVWKHCKLGNRCPDVHYYLPYRWEIYKGTDWEDVSDMEEIERQYCDPKFDRIPLIDSLTMRSGLHRVRRLSTISSVMKPPDYVLTTEWLWYWQDEYGSWVEYGQPNQRNSHISSSDLEEEYTSNPNAVVVFNIGNQNYEINFPEMKQRNIMYDTERDIRRRPRYLSFEDVKVLRGSTKSSAAQSSLKSVSAPLKNNIYPRTWDTYATPEIGCAKVLVNDTSSEFSEICSIFTRTLGGHVVKKMFRLQNPSLWQVYQWQKEQMKKLNQGRDVKEIRLFHGTDIRHVDAICNENFDWRICGTHGTMYGQGSYFARDASYSYNYSTPTPSGSRMMFVARVLVGDYVMGDPSMKRPPKKRGRTTRHYDSCVDNPRDPSIFVVFEKHQIFPEYLLEYEEHKQETSCNIL